MNRTKKRNRNRNAGEVIASGGFGCVFRPALKCKGKQRDSNKVSKLMTTKHAYDEYNDIKIIRDVLVKVPNYQNYYLLNDIYICDPDTLTNEDIKYFKDKCTALPKDNITENNINKKLGEMAVLNMPDGGMDISDYLLTVESDQQILQLNNTLINLLINGIVPMNKLRVYHCDIKESNVLIGKDNIPRLIDWGLASYDPTIGEVPSGSRNRPFQYNLPFSSIIFNVKFKEEYDKMLEQIPNPTITELHTFVVNFVFLWNKHRGPGHLKVINSMFKQMFYYNLIENVNEDVINNIIEYEYTYHTIIKYIVSILRRFTYDGKFHLNEYLEKVYLKNVDIWGFLMIYSPILEKLFDSFENLTERQIKLYKAIKNLYTKYLYSASIYPINVDNLVKDLKGLNPFFG